jgi:hypothetical protein
MIKLELILVDFANKVLDAKESKTTPKLGELVDEPKQKIEVLLYQSKPSY